MEQPSLFDQEEYTPDKIAVGHSKPVILHPDHPLKGMQKPFIAWDGEGYTDEFGIHHYWLLANSVGDKIIAPPGRSIERWNIARVFHHCNTRIPNAIHVGFALGYDFTMMLRSNGLTDRQREDLKHKQYLKADGYMWRMLMGKQMTTWSEAGGNAADRFNLQDTWGFFQRSFVNALDEYFDKDWPYRDTIVEMKAQRSTFTRKQDADVMSYNDMELELLVQLMEELRNRLFQAGMPVSRWYGPGAIANGLLDRWRIKNVITDLYKIEPNVAAAAQHAYAGGRFELVKPGRVNGKTYQYDVNSAYPYALSTVPDLADGEWKHYNNVDLDALPEFSVVRLRWTSHMASGTTGDAASSIMEIFPRSIPFPLWRRTPKGNIQYPSHGIHGWYWLPEVLAAIRYGDSLPDFYGITYEIEEAYGYHPNTNSKPYNTIPVLYNTRQKLKAKGNGAHIGIKLGLNSLYGKFAQQIGYDDKTHRIPPYHNLAIAGYVTAVCRSMMIDAARLNPEAVIAFETDGIFTNAELPLDIGIGLGEWDRTVYDDMYYYQSGFRFGILDGQVVKPATRGVPVKDIELDKVRATITNALSTIAVDHTQFISLNQAYAWRKPHLAGQWKMSPKTLQLMAENIGGKRVHDPDCPACDIDIDGLRHYRWDVSHITIPASGFEGMLSTAHKVLWSELAGVREETSNDIVMEL